MLSKKLIILVLKEDGYGYLEWYEQIWINNVLTDERLIINYE